MKPYDELSNDLEFLIFRHAIVNHSQGFAFDPPQVFPSHYLAPHRGGDVLCISYDMGTGKTLTAALVLRALLERVRRLAKVNVETTLPKPYIVGNWSTTEAFEDELFRPIFGFLSDNEYLELIMARREDKPDLYERLRSLYVTRVRKEVTIVSYQRLFNRYFRNSTSLMAKEEAILLRAIESGEVTIDPTIVAELTDSILVIDEPQSLYSGKGWNTYGTLLNHIRQNTHIKALTTILLSGTFVSTSPLEIIHLANLIRPIGTPRLDPLDYFKKEALPIMQSFIYSPIKHDAIIKLFDRKLVSYRISPSKDFPEFLLEGEAPAIGKMKYAWLRVHRCRASPEQWTKYNEYYDSPDDDVPVRDFLIPPTGAEPVEGSRGVYRGDFLKMAALRSKWGAIPAEFIRMLLTFIEKKQKAVAYHRNVEGGGLLQYSEALKANGFTLLGSPLLEEAICVTCRKTLADHHRKGVNHPFQPAIFALLFGRLSLLDRQRILSIYNSPENIDGSRVCCLLVSGVGETGITLLSTNYGIALGTVPGIPAWRQFRARIGRHSTHRDLPEKDRWVKMITMVLSPPLSTAKRPSKETYSRDEARYLIKEMNDKVSSTLWGEIEGRAMNRPYTSTSSTDLALIKPPKTPSRVAYDILYRPVDVDDAKRIIVHLLSTVSPMWRLDRLSQVIHSNEVRIVPRNTTFLHDDAIGEAITRLVHDGRCVLRSLTSSVVPSFRSASPKVVIILLGDADAYLPSSTFSAAPVYVPGCVSSQELGYWRSQSYRVHRWQPLRTEGSREELDKLFRLVGETNGSREKTIIFDNIIMKMGFLPRLYADFDARGGVYQLLRRHDNIIWKGDVESHLTFAANRMSKSEIEPIGFILGSDYHRRDGKDNWSKIALPIRATPSTSQWKLAAIFSPGSSATSGKWHTRFRLRPIGKETKDLRRLRRGMACTSLPTPVLEEYLDLLSIDATNGKSSSCKDIETSLLSKQLSAGETPRYIYTPFESAG